MRIFEEESTLVINWSEILRQAFFYLLDLIKHNPSILMFLLVTIALSVVLKIKSGASYIGARGEQLTERELKLVNLFGRKGKTLRNLYLPKDDGGTSEIDIVYITQKGIFVFESKNYSGWIFGDEKSQYWTTTLPNGTKNRFYNPIKQNSSHIKWLQKYVGEEVPLFSIIVFSERSELKRIRVESSDVKVIKRDRTYATVREIWEKHADILTDTEQLYEKLKPLTDVDAALKMAHIDNIKKKYSTS